MSDANIPPKYWILWCDMPPPGHFYIRYREKIESADLKLDAQNESGVFLGFSRFDHMDNKFGVVILVIQSLVVARHNVESFKEKKPSFTLGIALQVPWKEKMLQPKFMILIIFYLTHSLSSSLRLAHNRTQRSSTLHLHVQMMTMLSTCHRTMKKLKIC